jgi:hypothetical protein
MKERYFSTFQLILLALFAALIVVAKIALRLPLQLSGHSGIFWMAIVIVAAGVVPKVGAASMVGLTSGIIAGFLGLGDFGALNTFLSYTMVGVGTWAANRKTWSSPRLRRPLGTFANSWSSGDWGQSPARRLALWPWDC